MSGSFEDLDVPPTLVSFATAVGKVDRVTSPEFKGAGHRVVLIAPRCYDADDVAPAAEDELAAIAAVEGLIGEGAALAVSTPGYGCAAESLFKMCVGNQLGVGSQLQTAVIVVLGIRIFSNVSAIRRFIFRG